MQSPTSATSQACTTVLETAARLGLTDQTRATATSLVNAVYDDELYYGRTREATLSAVVLVSCRQTDDFVPTKKVAEAFGVDKKQMFTASRYLSKQLSSEMTLQFEHTSVVRHVCECVGASQSYTDHAIDMCGQAVEQNLHSDRSLGGFAAGVVYATGLTHGRESYTQETVADAADVTTVTIRQTYPAFTNLHANEQEN